jgi:hypothetical protein
MLVTKHSCESPQRLQLGFRLGMCFPLRSGVLGGKLRGHLITEWQHSIWVPSLGPNSKLNCPLSNQVILMLFTLVFFSLWKVMQQRQRGLQDNPLVLSGHREEELRCSHRERPSWMGKWREQFYSFLESDEPGVKLHHCPVLLWQIREINLTSLSLSFPVEN